MVVSGVNAVYIVGTFKHLGTDADFKVHYNDWIYIYINDINEHNWSKACLYKNKPILSQV